MSAACPGCPACNELAEAQAQVDEEDGRMIWFLHRPEDLGKPPSDWMHWASVYSRAESWHKGHYCDGSTKKD